MVDKILEVEKQKPIVNGSAGKRPLSGGARKMWLANLNVRRDACVEKRAGDRGPRGISGGRQGGADVADRAA